MEGPYKLVGEVLNEGSVRSMAIGPLGEVISGTQASAPAVHRWAISYDRSVKGLTQRVDKLGDCIFHDHWVTALTSITAGKGLVK